jgi:hypothetical protein
VTENVHISDHAQEEAIREIQQCLMDYDGGALPFDEYRPSATAIVEIYERITGLRGLRDD